MSSPVQERQGSLLIEQEQETYVLARSVERAKKEEAMRWRQIRGLMRDLIKLRRSIGKGMLSDPDKVLMRLGRLSERWPRAWHYLWTEWKEGKLTWHWDRQALRLAQHRDGAYLLRTNVSDLRQSRRLDEGVAAQSRMALRASIRSFRFQKRATDLS